MWHLIVASDFDLHCLPMGFQVKTGSLKYWDTFSYYATKINVVTSD